METQDRFAKLNEFIAQEAAKQALRKQPPARPMPDRLVLNDFYSQVERMPCDHRND